MRSSASFFRQALRLRFPVLLFHLGLDLLQGGQIGRLPRVHLNDVISLLPLEHAADLLFLQTRDDLDEIRNRFEFRRNIADPEKSGRVDLQLLLRRIGIEVLLLVDGVMSLLGLIRGRIHPADLSQLVNNPVPTSARGCILSPFFH